MRKNIASQIIGVEMVSATDGSAFTGTVTVYVTGDGGTQAIGSVGSGVCTHEGNGFHTYVPAQAETNYNHVAFTFIGTGAVPVTIQVYPVSYNPTDAVRLGLTALPNAAADAAGGLPISDAGGLDMDAILTYAISSAAWGSINSGTLFRGTVTADNPGVSFTIAGLIGQGAGAFVDANTPWYAYVFRDGGGVAGAPQGQVRKILTYVSATGLFTTDAFTTPVATGDDMMIVSAALINSLAIKTRVELALPNAAPDGVGGLPISDAGGLDIDTLLGRLDATVSTRATPAQVNAEVLDILDTDVNVELSAIPTTVSPLRKMIQYLFQYFRNKRTVTATTETLLKEDASTTLGTATLSDNGTTFSKGEMN